MKHRAYTDKYPKLAYINIQHCLYKEDITILKGKGQPAVCAIKRSLKNR